MIKVVAANAWETVETAEQALETAETMERNGWGVAHFEMQDDDGNWVQVDADDI
jgi:hypothetical protein